MNHFMVIHFQSPLCQDIESGHGPRPACPEIGPHAMPHLLTMEDGGDHREHRFHQYAHVPCPTLTDFHIGGIPGLGMEPRIRHDDHRMVKLGNQGLKMRGVDVRRGAIPGTDQAPVVQDETELAPNNSSMIPLPLLAHLGGAAPFPHGMDQLDPIASGDAQGGLGDDETSA